MGCQTGVHVTLHSPPRHRCLRKVLPIAHCLPPPSLQCLGDHTSSLSLAQTVRRTSQLGIWYLIHSFLHSRYQVSLDLQSLLQIWSNSLRICSDLGWDCWVLMGEGCGGPDKFPKFLWCPCWLCPSPENQSLPIPFPCPQWGLEPKYFWPMC